MIVRSVTLSGLGPFAEEATIHFPSDGLNVVMGPNESGKSILLKSIRAVLFGWPPDDFERYRRGATPEGRIRFSLEDIDYEIVRYFAPNEVVWWKMQDGERRQIFAGQDWAAYARALESVIGFSQEEVATATTFVSQGDMTTGVTPLLRDALCRSKRGDYQRILDDLHSRQHRLADAGGEWEHLHHTLEALKLARTEAGQALDICMTLEEEAHALEQSLASVQLDVESASRALGALDMLEKLQVEEQHLQTQMQSVAADEVRVLQLQSDVAACLAQVENEHAALLPLQSTFLDEVFQLEEHRTELADLQREVDDLNAHRRDLQGQVRTLTEEFTSRYGAYEDLPLDFPDRLLLYPLRHREWTTLTAELKAIDEALTSLQNEMDERFHRFKRFDDHHPQDLRDLSVQETYWHQQLHDLEEDRHRCQQTAQTIAGEEYRLKHEFGSFMGVAKDFRNRLRNWHRLYTELQSRRGPVEKAQQEMANIQAAMEFYQQAVLEGPTSVVEAHTSRLQVETEYIALQKEMEHVDGLTKEREAIVRRIDKELSHLKNGIEADFPARLREHLQLREEYLHGNQQLQAAEARLAQAQLTIEQRFSRFRNQSSEWGERLVAHAAAVDIGRVALEQLEGEEAEVSQLRSELETLQLADTDDAHIFHGLAETFPETLKEYNRVKSSLHDNQQETEEHPRRHPELVGLASDMVAVIEEYTDSRSRLRTLAAQLAEGKDTVSRYQRKLAAMDIVLNEDYPQYQEDLSPRPDNPSEDPDYLAFRKLSDERAALVSQTETTQAGLQRSREEHDRLESRLEALADQLGGQQGSDAETLLARYRTFGETRERLENSRRDDERRLLQLGTMLGPLTERFVGDPSDWTDLMHSLTKRFRAHQKRCAQMEALTIRLQSLQDPKALATQRNQVVAAIAQEATALRILDVDSIHALVEDWHEYQTLLQRIGDDEALVKTLTEGDDGPNKLEILTSRLLRLATELGSLVNHPDLEVLIGEITVFFTLQARMHELDTLLAGLRPRDVVEAALMAAAKERGALVALGLRPEPTVPVVAEDGFKHWKETLEQLEARLPSLLRQLELEIQDGQSTTVLDRLQRRLDEQGAGLGDFAAPQLTGAHAVVDLDATLRRYDEYLALTVQLEGLRKTLDILPSETELAATHRQLTDEMEAARRKLGLEPGETVDQVLGQWDQYAELTRQWQHHYETRNKMLAGLSVGDWQNRSTTEVLAEVGRVLDELRNSLGGFEDAGDETEEIIAQFHASEALKARIRGVQGNLAALRTMSELEELLQSARQPVLALEARLQVVGDVHNVAALRSRFAAFAALQEMIRSLTEALEQSPTLDTLATTRQGLIRALEAVDKDILLLFKAETGLHAWYQKYEHEPQQLRPALTHHLETLQTQASQLDHQVNSTWSKRQDHIHQTGDRSGNLARLDEEIQRRQKELIRLSNRREALKRAVDILSELLGAIPEHLRSSLEIRAREALRVVTNGRYCDLDLEGEAMEPVVKQDATVLRGENITGGLRDQLYFALHAAMTQELSGTIILPFLLDDPFIHLDHARLQHAQTCLKNLGEQCQVILFTHDERFHDCGPVAHDLGQHLASPNGHTADTPPTVTAG